MPNWYLYYRIMRAVKDGETTQSARIELQDVLIELRGRAQREWPEATDQEIQDFFGYLSRNPTIFTEAQARHLANMESWSVEEVINVAR
jgi:hypothetical protein